MRRVFGRKDNVVLPAKEQISLVCQSQTTIPRQGLTVPGGLSLPQTPRHAAPIGETGPAGTDGPCSTPQPIGVTGPMVFGMHKPSTQLVKEERPSQPTITRVVIRHARTIEGVYDDSLNILSIHNKVVDHYDAEKRAIPSYEQEIKRLSWVRDRGATSYERTKAQSTIRDLEKKIGSVSKKKQDYMKRVEKLVEDFKVLSSPNERKQFGEKEDKTPEWRRNRVKRRIIIEKYLIVASTFYPINLYREPPPSNACPECDTVLTAKDAGDGEEYLNCSECGFTALQGEDAGRDYDGTASARNNYTKGNHIKEAIAKYEGRQKNTLSRDLIPNIEKAMGMYGIRKESLTLESLHLLMKDLDYSDNYEDIHLIYHLLTDVPLPDLSEIREKLNERADRLSEAYIEAKPDGRKNFVSSQFILWVLLQQEEDPGYHYPDSDFIFPRTRDILLQYEAILSPIFKRFGWKYMSPI